MTTAELSAVERDLAAAQKAKFISLARLNERKTHRAKNAEDRCKYALTGTAYWKMVEALEEKFGPL